MHKILALKKTILVIFGILSVFAVLALGNLKFSFDFSQFFPEGDPDLIFYNEFIEEFGTDDNFLLIAIENESTVFDQAFLERFDALSKEAKKLPFVTQSQSLTTLFYPLKTSFGYTKLPIIHINDSTKYASDFEKLKEDNFYTNALIDENGTSLVLALETEDKLDYEQSIVLLTKVRSLLNKHGLKNHHLLGRTYFYEALVAMQKHEVTVTSIASILLIFLVLLLIYRRILIVFIALFSITIALLLFLGLLSVLGKELNAMAAFYPILMLIVGTSDVIHIVDDYLIKLKTGLPKEKALWSTLKEVGTSTLLTSATTAIGFASLLTSKSSSISDFGLNAAIGVLTAFVTVIFLTSALILLPKKEYLLPKREASKKWPKLLSGINNYTKKHHRPILYGSLIFTLVCTYGITKIDTNYQIKESLPTNSTIASDFKFFQDHYSGFRPLEVAVMTQGESKISDFDVIQQIEKVEQQLRTEAPIKNINSISSFYKTLHKAHNLNKSDFFVLPKDSVTFESYKADINKMARKQYAKFVNKNETKSRIRARVLDVGTDTLNQLYERFDRFTAAQTDSSQVKFKLTGSGVLLDKNSYYIQDSLISGLLAGLLMVALIMALLFKNLKLLLISLLPNLVPLLFAGALLGYLNIPLESTISVVFAIVFGIAVDDTIHFLGRYKLSRDGGLSKEAALEVTFLKTGRALIITTTTLFFGFLILLFSAHAPSVTIGLLVSITLLTALVLDLLLLPVLIRKWLR
ncbi:efflux RND transporter permease subunit [Zobellia roscoffensis]|uniref:efflux RND transporter permease subunit n=1 Tax=Zobellia roscoffensis TaxID=2779508 RepID=UPI00188A35E6|nr:MMPL family transporter [Zobellia roscoffensis]